MIYLLLVFLGLAVLYLGGWLWMADRSASETRRRLDRLVNILDFPDQGPWVRKMIDAAPIVLIDGVELRDVDLSKFKALVVKTPIVLGSNTWIHHGRFIGVTMPVLTAPDGTSWLRITNNWFSRLGDAINRGWELQDLTPRSKPPCPTIDLEDEESDEEEWDEEEKS